MSAPNLEVTVAQNAVRAVADAEADMRKAAQKFAAELENLKRAIGYAELQRAMEATNQMELMK